VNRRTTIAFWMALGFAVCVSGYLTAVADRGPSSRPDATVSSAAPQSRAAATQRVQNARQQVESTLARYTYLGLFGILLLTGFGLPLPEEVPLLLAGYFAKHGTGKVGLLMLVGLAGALSADLIIFAATRKWRQHILQRRFVRAMIRPRDLVRARRQFNRHGLKIVFVARWLPALRTAVCVTAGLMGISIWRFMLIDATAACITVPTSVGIGYLAASHIDRLIVGVIRAEHLTAAALIGTILVVAAYRIVRWRYFNNNGQNGNGPAES